MSASTNSALLRFAQSGDRQRRYKSQTKQLGGAELADTGENQVVLILDDRADEAGRLYAVGNLPNLLLRVSVRVLRVHPQRLRRTEHNLPCCR